MLRGFTGEDSYPDVDKEGITKAEKFWIHIKNLLFLFDEEAIREFPRLFTIHANKEEKYFQKLFKQHVVQGEDSLSMNRMQEVITYFDTLLKEKGCVDG